ncbi:MAG: hypothetical protein HQK96_06580 [Nitrospirae bacterium]|nr:hypothetical protein [Nitrospirota bacterium]
MLMKYRVYAIVLVLTLLSGLMLLQANANLVPTTFGHSNENASINSLTSFPTDSISLEPFNMFSSELTGFSHIASTPTTDMSTISTSTPTNIGLQNDFFSNLLGLHSFPIIGQTNNINIATQTPTTTPYQTPTVTAKPHIVPTVTTTPTSASVTMPISTPTPTTTPAPTSTPTPTATELANSPTPTSGPIPVMSPSQSTLSDYQKYVKWVENGGDPNNDGLIMAPQDYDYWCQRYPNASKPWLQ